MPAAKESAADLFVFVGNRLVREFVQLRQRNARRRGVGVEGSPDRVVVRAQLEQFLAQELVAVDAHTRDAYNLLEELECSAFCLVFVPGGASARLNILVTGLLSIEHRVPPYLAARQRRAHVDPL